jgi:hypothetical protein
LADIDSDGAVTGALPAGLVLDIQGLDDVLRLDGSLFDENFADMPGVTRLLLLDSSVHIADFGCPALNQNVAEIRHRLC